MKPIITKVMGVWSVDSTPVYSRESKFIRFLRKFGILEKRKPIGAYYKATVVIKPNGGYIRPNHRVLDNNHNTWVVTKVEGERIDIISISVLKEFPNISELIVIGSVAPESGNHQNL